MIVESPKNGAIRRAAAISAPSVDAPTTKTRTLSSAGRRRVLSPAAADSVAVTGLVLVGDEVGFPGPADRAVPIVGDVLEHGSRRDSAVRIAFSRIVDEPAGLAF